MVQLYPLRRSCSSAVFVNGKLALVEQYRVPSNKLDEDGNFMSKEVVGSHIKSVVVMRKCNCLPVSAKPKRQELEGRVQGEDSDEVSGVRT